jgi:hypothetical protein
MKECQGTVAENGYWQSTMHSVSRAMFIPNTLFSERALEDILSFSGCKPGSGLPGLVGINTEMVSNVCLLLRRSL